MADGRSKKSQIASERDEEVRSLWRWLASHFDARRLVFVDESDFQTSMTRLRARAPKGKRAYGKVARNRGKNTTLMAAITLEGATDAEAFEVYVEHFLWHPHFLKGRWWCSMGWERTERRRSGSSSKQEGQTSCVLALLLAGLEPHRGGLQQDQGASAQGGRPRARGAS
jgi:hypothetical protein